MESTGAEPPPADLNVDVQSRFEARLALETAVELRYPRLIYKKPIFASQPLGRCLLVPFIRPFGLASPAKPIRTPSLEPCLTGDCCADLYALHQAVLRH